jgi:phospholipid/cholesterol/gamma-HCH transport system substrate-binding protein
MNTNTTKFKVRLGLFVVVGFIIFAFAIFLIGRQRHLFDPIFKLTTTFNNISGLQIGNNIRFSGINVGTVDNIKIINDSTVQVDMILKKSIQSFIKADCQATIGSEGLIGNKMLIITQGSTLTKAVSSGQMISSQEPLEMETIITSLNVTAQNAETISKQLVEIMIGINQGDGTIGRLIRDTSIAENINQTIINFEKTSYNLDKNIDSMMVSVNQATDNILISSVELSQIMKNINEQDGTIGKLIRDSIMANEVQLTILSLKQSGDRFSNTMEAINNSFLFRRYFRKKAERERHEELDSLNSKINKIQKK